ncbi:hypothetical protein [Nocardia thraciensis]
MNNAHGALPQRDPASWMILFGSSIPLVAGLRLPKVDEITGELLSRTLTGLRAWDPEEES